MNKKRIKQFFAVCLAGSVMFLAAACSGKPELGNNLVSSDEGGQRIVRMFSPMETTQPDVDNVARSASDKTVVMAEETLGVSVDYITYTAEN